MRHIPKFVPTADGCCRDVSRQYLREDGVWCFLEWTPTLNLDKPIPFKEAPALAAACELAGGGWKAPTPQQLQSIADYGRFNPAIDTSVPTFEDTSTDRIYWTDQVDASSPSVFAIFVDFTLGDVSWDLQSYHGFVRACRLVPASQ